MQTLMNCLLKSIDISIRGNDVDDDASQTLHIRDRLKKAVVFKDRHKVPCKAALKLLV